MNANTNTTTTTEEQCWVCDSTRIEAGGFDDTGEPITVCSDCGNRQEEE